MTTELQGRSACLTARQPASGKPATAIAETVTRVDVHMDKPACRAPKWHSTVAGQPQLTWPGG
jgi:hypothetical protein